MSRFPNPKTKISSLCSYKIKLNLYSLKRDGQQFIQYHFYMTIHDDLSTQ